jgi:hypothetical protein
MVRGVRLSLVVLGVSMVGHGSAWGAFFSVEVNLLFQGGAPGLVTQNRSGSEPVDRDTGEVASADGLRFAEASGIAGRGMVDGFALTQSKGLKVTAISNPSASYDDIVVSWTGPGPAPADFVSFMALNYNISATQGASGFLGSLGFNGQDIQYTVSFNGVSEGGTIVWDPGGNTGQHLLGAHQLVSPLVPLNQPVSMSLSMFMGTRATQLQTGSTVTTSLSARIQVTSTGLPAAMPQGVAVPFADEFPGPVFDLPAGFTVNSVSMGVVNNRWVAAPVPEPGTALAGVAGFAMLLCRRGSRRNIAEN